MSLEIKIGEVAGMDHVHHIWKNLESLMASFGIIAPQSRLAQLVRQLVRWPVAWPVELVKDISRVFSTPHHKYSVLKTLDCEDIYTTYNFCEFLESIMVHFRYRAFFVNPPNWSANWSGNWSGRSWNSPNFKNWKSENCAKNCATVIKIAEVGGALYISQMKNILWS